MKTGISSLMAVILLCGIAGGKEPVNPSADKLKCFAPFIGIWRYEGPSIEEVPGIAKKGTKCCIEFSWRRILNSGAVESSLRVKMGNGDFSYSDKNLCAWSATEEKLVLAGASNYGSVFLGDVKPAQEDKQLTISWCGTDSDGSPTSSKAVFTIKDRNTLTFEAIEREGPIIQGPSPVYTLKRVNRRQAATTAECPWTLITGHWKLTDETGNESEVVWKKSAGDSLVGLWKGKSGKATELVGWRPNRGELVATGYGDKGEFWEVRFTTVTKNMIKGPTMDRSPEGQIRRGTFQITRKSDNELDTLFEGMIDGKKAVVKGCFTRAE